MTPIDRPFPSHPTRPVVLALAAVVLGAGLAGPGTTAEAAAPPFPDSGYTLRLLDLPAGGGGSGYAINEHGEVAGSVTPAGGPERAVTWDAGGARHELPVADGSASVARLLDDRGRVAGTLSPYPDVAEPVVWSGGRAAQLIEPDVDYGVPTLMNRAGQVAGAAGNYVTTPFLWTPSRTPAFVEMSGRGQIGQFFPYDLDDAGNLYAVASGPVGTLTSRLFRRSPGGHEINVLAGLEASGIVPQTIWRVAVSETGAVGVTLSARRRGVSGQLAVVVPPGKQPLIVAGGFDGRELNPQTFVVANDRGQLVFTDLRYVPDCYGGRLPGFALVQWDPSGEVVDLPSPGGCGPTVLDINDAGEIIGTATVGSATVPFVFDPDHGYRGLVGARYVTAINEAGSILGLVDDGAGGLRPAVWDPPEGHAVLGQPAAADTWLTPSSSRGFGTGPSLTAGGGAQALLRFTVPAPPAGRHLVAATLLLTATTESGAGTTLPLDVRAVTGAWTEASTWATRPALDKRRLGVLGAVAKGEPVSVRVDPADVPAGGVLDLAVVGTSSDVVKLASREATSASARPSLELIYR